MNNLAQIYFIVSIVGFILSGVLLAVSIFLFIKLNIPKIIGDLSGRTAKKSIEQMREENEKSGKKSYRPHPVASSRGTLTEPISEPPKNAKKQSKKAKAQSPASVPLAPTMTGNETEILDDANKTVPLNYDMNGTEVLGEGTEVLSQSVINEALNPEIARVKMLQSIVLVHTEEVI